jgi:hypothetical protein
MKVGSVLPWAAESRRVGRKPVSREVPPLRLAFVFGSDNPSNLIGGIPARRMQIRTTRRWGQFRARPIAAIRLSREIAGRSIRV